MHELGIVFHIIDSIEEVGRQNKLRRVSTVTLELGEVSGVVPELLGDAWKWACAREPMMEGCELEVEDIPAVTHCEACGTDYGTVEHGRICPACGSDQTYLLRGREVMIKQIEAY